MTAILTYEQLYSFFENKTRSVHFQANNKNEIVHVQVPSTYEEIDDSRQGLMKLKIKVLHTGSNRNKSFVSEESAKKAFSSFKNRPILATIHQLDDGEWDFDSHNMEIITNEDGEEEVHYIEQQVGSFTEDEPFFEYDEEMDKTYVCAYAVIPESYTKAADIIRRKNGTKNSCELAIEEFSYDAKNKELSLDSWYLTGSTLLGTNQDGKQVEEGMLGSRADEISFSTKTALKTNYEKDIVEALDKITTLLSDFQNTKEITEGGKESVKLNELLEKYGKTLDDIDFEVEGLSDEELEQKFSENFDEKEPVVNENEMEKQCSIQLGENTYNFAVSLNEKIYALEKLVNTTYSEADNAYYAVQAYDKYVVMVDYWSGKAFRQTYANTEDSYTLTGDRIEVYAHYVTADEDNALDELQSKYSALETQLNEYVEAEEKAKKETILKSEDYALINESEDFKLLTEAIEQFSSKELQEKCDALLLDYVKKNKTFAQTESQKKTVKTVHIGAEKEKDYSPYGSLFANK